MSRFLEWWQRVEGRYTYRIPTAALTASALLIATGLWAVASDGRAGPGLAAGAPGGRQVSGAGTPSSGGDVGPGDAAATPYTDPGDVTATTVSATGGSPTASGSSGPAATTGSTTAGGAQPGTSAAASSTQTACPAGLDKDDCTGVTDKLIRIGTHAAETQCGTALPDTSDENEAEADDWVEYVNKIEGGVHGRLLELHTADDGYCPEMAGQAANKLIDEDRVFAVQGFLGVDQNRVVAEKAQSRRVPYLAGGGPREWAGRWSVFHQNQSGYDVMYPALLKYIVGAKGLNRPNAAIGMMYVNTPDVKDPWNRARQAVPQANVKVALPLNQGIQQNFLEEIRQMQAANVDTVFCHCHPLNMVAFVQQADSQQFKPQYTFVSQGADLDVVLRLFPGDSTWAKNVKGLSNFCHQTHKCAAPYGEKLKKIKPNAILSQLSLVGIHAIEMFAEPMRRAGPELSRTKYAQQLQGLEGWTTGLTGPVDLAPDRSVGAIGFAVYHSPGSGSRNYQMVDVDGQAYRNDWS